MTPQFAVGDRVRCELTGRVGTIWKVGERRVSVHWDGEERNPRYNQFHYKPQDLERVG